MVKKLSVAAAVAVASMSVASATPLTEAIKNADLNGMLRLRFHNYTEVIDNQSSKRGYNKWEVAAKLVFKFKVDENLDFVWRFSSNEVDYSTAIIDDPNHNSTGDAALKTNLLFFKYHKDGLAVLGGKIGVPTPITSAEPIRTAHGAGVLAQYQVIDGLTIAGGWVDKLINANQAPTIVYLSDYTAAGNYIYNDNTPTLMGGNLVDTDIFVAAANYHNDLVNASLWYFNIPNVLDYDWIAQVAGKYKLGNEVTLCGGVDYAQSKLSKHVYYLNKVTTDDGNGHAGTYKGLAILSDTTLNSLTKKISNDWHTKTYIHVYAGAKMDMGSVKVGYAHTNNKFGVITLDDESPLNDIFGLEKIRGIVNETNANAIYTNLAYNVMKNLQAYLNVARIREGGHLYAVEYKIGATYDYSKKVSFGAYFDNTNYGAYYKNGQDDGQTGFPTNTQEFQVEAKYKF